MIKNKVTLSGVIATQFRLDHEYYNERYFQFMLNVKRSSGADDTIVVIVSERLLDVTKDMTGQYINIVGEYRSFNAHSGHKTKVLLYVFPLLVTLLKAPDDHNEIILEGNICKPPIYRETPNGRMITDVLLAVSREYNKRDYIPAIAWGRNAYYMSTLPVGTAIRIAGRVQSRTYIKNDDVLTAYEVSISLIERV